MPVENDPFDELPAHLTRLVPLLATGMTNAAMADHLSLAVHTIENYVAELKEALDARDRVDLVLRCQARTG